MIMNDAASRLVRQYTVEHYDGSQRQQRSFTTCAETTLTIYIGGRSEERRVGKEC